jgi:hypothetical protein
LPQTFEEKKEEILAVSIVGSVYFVSQQIDQNEELNKKKSVLRIPDQTFPIPDPGSEFFPSRIPDPHLRI